MLYAHVYLVLDVGARRVLMPIRYYLTGMDVGAGLGDTIELLGRETVLRRLKFE